MTTRMDVTTFVESLWLSPLCQSPHKAKQVRPLKGPVSLLTEENQGCGSEGRYHRLTHGGPEGGAPCRRRSRQGEAQTRLTGPGILQDLGKPDRGLPFHTLYSWARGYFSPKFFPHWPSSWWSFYYYFTCIWKYRMRKARKSGKSAPSLMHSLSSALL